MTQLRFLPTLAATLAALILQGQTPPKAVHAKPATASPIIQPADTATKTPDATARKAKAALKAAATTHHRTRPKEFDSDAKMGEALVPMQSREPSFRTEEEAVVRESRWVKDLYHDPATIPVVNCGVNLVSMILLPPAEQIIENGSFGGNTQLWGITPVVGKNVIFIKPVMENTYTNLTVVTKVGNIYQFALRVDPRRPPVYRLRILPPETDSGAMGVLTPGVMPTTDGVQAAASPLAQPKRGIEPEEAKRMVQEAVAQTRAEDQSRAADEKKAFAEAMLEGRNDNYAVSYDRGAKFKVTHVFDVAGVTYIRYKTSDQVQPSFYVIGKDGNTEAVTWLPSPEDPSVLMVDRVFVEGVLKVGDKSAKITNKGLNAALKRELEKEPKEVH